MRAPSGSRGFSSIEAVLVLALLGIATLGMAHSVVTGQRGLQHIEDDSRVLHQAQILMSRLASLPFGNAADPLPDPVDVGMLLSIENDLLGAPGGPNDPSNPLQLYTGSDLTLRQVGMLAQPLSWQYATGGDSYYGRGGTWELVVDRDLNGDGDLLDPLELATALDQDLLRIEIRHEGRRVLRTLRSREPLL